MQNHSVRSSILTLAMAGVMLLGSVAAALAGDLADVKKSGVLRHLGVAPYGNFVDKDANAGLDVETIKLFAKELGVTYAFVPSTWGTIIPDLTGKQIKPKGEDVEILGDCPVKGDVIATGMTVLPWREKIVDFSTPTFPNQVWVVTRKDTGIKPIKSTGSLDKDIVLVKKAIKGKSVLHFPGTCLDAALYNVAEYGAKVVDWKGQLLEMVPAVMKGEYDATVMDVPDCLVDLAKYPDKMVIVGPVSEDQFLAYGFSQQSPELRAAFNAFLEKIKKDGTLVKLVKKYYPSVFVYYGDFFKK